MNRANGSVDDIIQGVREKVAENLNVDQARIRDSSEPCQRIDVVLQEPPMWKVQVDGAGYLMPWHHE